MSSRNFVHLSRAIYNACTQSYCTIQWRYITLPFNTGWVRVHLSIMLTTSSCPDLRYKTATMEPSNFNPPSPRGHRPVSLSQATRPLETCIRRYLDSYNLDHCCVFLVYVVPTLHTYSYNYIFKITYIYQPLIPYANTTFGPLRNFAVLPRQGQKITFLHFSLIASLRRT